MVTFIKPAATANATTQGLTSAAPMLKPIIYVQSMKPAARVPVANRITNVVMEPVVRKTNAVWMASVSPLYVIIATRLARLHMSAIIMNSALLVHLTGVLLMY